MGSIATEVTQTTTVHRTTTQASTFRTPPRTTINWFEGPAGETSYIDFDCGHAPSSNPFHTVTRITAEPVPKKSIMARARKGYTRWCSKFNNMDPVKLAYLRTSFVFAISVLVTWTPSSINRVHDLINQTEVSFGLNLTAGIVLPLQGVWNTVIFFSTSSVALRDELRGARDRFRGLPRGHQAASEVRHENGRVLELERRYCPGPSEDDAESHASSSTVRIMRDGPLSRV